MTAPVTVLLVDDHALVRRGFRRLLEDDPTVTVVGEASTGEEAVRLAVSLAPRVVVLDCALPGTHGLEVLEVLRSRVPQTAVLMLSMHAEETLVRRALEAGAAGYVLKSALDLDLAGAVARVAAGETVLDPGLAARASGAEPPRALTPRELEVLQLICEGLSNREAADRLGVSANTVAVHRASIMNTLGVHKTAELVVYALRRGLVTPP